MPNLVLRAAVLLAAGPVFAGQSTTAFAPETRWLEALANRIETVALRQAGLSEAQTALANALLSGEEADRSGLDACIERAAPKSLSRLTSAALACARDQRRDPLDEAARDRVAKALVSLTGYSLDKYLDKAEVAKLSIRSRAANAFTQEDITTQLNDAVMTIALRSFDAETPRRIREAVLSERTNLTGLVLDLRGNEGGLLDACIQTADLFLTEGEITSLRNKRGIQMVFRADRSSIASHVPITVLVDGGTANGAELVAAALVDNDRAYLAGTATKGVGTIRTLFPLSAETFALITTEEFLRPTREPIDGIGLRPSLPTQASSKD